MRGSQAESSERSSISLLHSDRSENESTHTSFSYLISNLAHETGTKSKPYNYTVMLRMQILQGLVGYMVESQ